MTNAPAVPRRSATLPRLSLSAALAWLIAADRAYRARCHMRELSDASLRDVGLRRDSQKRLQRP